MSGDPAQESFSDGLTEDVITDLSHLKNLIVISRSSVFAYKGKPIKADQVGHELGVHYVLEGSFRKSGERVRITAQLVDATTGYHLWAQRYDRDFNDIFAIQDDITKKIVTAMAGYAVEKVRAEKQLYQGIGIVTDACRPTRHCFGERGGPDLLRGPAGAEACISGAIDVEIRYACDVQAASQARLDQKHGTELPRPNQADPHGIPSVGAGRQHCAQIQ